MLDAMSRMLPAVLAVLAGWVTTTTPLLYHGPVEVKLKERFRVMVGARHVGFLIFSQIADEKFFRIVTPSGIPVGEVHKYGRFFKWELFADRPRDIGFFTMKEGLAKLFETDETIRVFPLEGRGAATEAAALKLLKKALADN